MQVGATRAPFTASNVRRINLARLREHPDGHVDRHEILFDQLTQEVEVRLRLPRESPPRSP